MIFGKKQEKEQTKEKETLSKAERLENGQLFCRAIIEILGKPKEHIEETLKGYIEKIKTDETYDIIKEDYADTKPQGKVFSKFVEIELWIKGVQSITDFCLDYMPSSFEVIEPGRITFNNTEFANFVNDLLAKLHQVDMAVKNLKIENDILKRNDSVLLRNIITMSLSQGDKTAAQMSKQIGIPAEQLEKFISVMIKDKRISKQGDRYHLTK